MSGIINVNWTTPGNNSISVCFNYAYYGIICTSATATLDVTVNQIPNPIITGSDIACVGSFEGYSTESGYSDYVWNVSSGGVITYGGGSNATVNWTSSGNQWVSVIYTNNGCTPQNATVFNVYVNNITNPTITGSDTVCTGGTISYETEPSMSDYSWSVSPGGSISGGLDNVIVITWNALGNQWVKVSYTDLNGCETSVTQKPITVLYMTRQRKHRSL